MRSVCFSYSFLGGGLLVFMLIGWRAANNHVLCSWAKYTWADDSEERNVCFASLTWLCGLFVRMLMNITHKCISQMQVDPH